MHLVDLQQSEGFQLLQERSVAGLASKHTQTATASLQGAADQGNVAENTLRPYWRTTTSYRPASTHQLLH